MEGKVKHITVMIPSQGRSVEVSVGHGMKVTEILSGLKLADTHHLSRRIGGRAIGTRSSIYGQVEDSTVLFACQRVSVSQMDLPLEIVSPLD